MTKQITFKAYIPPIQSALKFGGSVGRITLEIPETEMQKAIGLIALQNCVLNITVEMDKGVQTIKSVRAKKEPESSGPFAAYWNELFIVKFHHMEMVWEVLGVESAAEVKPALYKIFDVETMSDVSPMEFEAWADKNHLQPLITLSRQAVMKTAA